MKHHTFKGTHFEIGKQQGKRYKKDGALFDNPTDKKLLEKQRRLYAEHYPAFLEQCRGIAEEGAYDEDAVLWKFICLPVLVAKEHADEEKGCTIFGVQTKDGTIVGRNYDWRPEAEQVCEEYSVSPSGYRAYIGVSDMWIWAPEDVKRKQLFYDPEDVINENGLYVGMTFAYNRNWSYGLVPMHIVQLIAETCSSVDDAVEVFGRVPVCKAKNFFVADSRGEMAVIEHTAKTFQTVRPDDGILIQTNNYVAPGLEREDTVLQERPETDTYIRYYEALQQINKRKTGFSLADVKAVLHNHHTHIFERQKTIRTIWSLVLDMKGRTYYLCSHLHNKKPEERKLAVQQ